MRAQGGRPTRDGVLGYWLLPLPTIDPFIVKRSAAALEDYGPEFTYSHYAGFKSLRYAAGGAAGVGLLTVAAQVKPVRDFLKSRVPQGSGPDDAKREKSWFTVELVGDDPLRRAMGAEARELSRGFDIATAVRAYERVYEELVSS